MFSNIETDFHTLYRSGQALETVIAAAIQAKMKVRAGMTAIVEINDSGLHQDNRNMITIGG